MDTETIKNAIVKNVYYIDSGKDIAMHKHNKHDEVFYCMKGNGFGVLENDNVPLSLGKAFIVPAGTMHSLKTDEEMTVASFLIPLLE